MNSLDRVTIASRVFCIAAILGLIVISRDAQAILSLILVALVAPAAVYVSSRTVLSPTIVVTGEAGLVGLVIGLALPGGIVLLPYLVVLTLIAGIAQGVVGVSAVALSQVLTIGIVTATMSGLEDRTTLYLAMAPWIVTSILAGLTGAWLKESGRLSVVGTGDSYESARRLLSQLRTVARRLSSGLDLVGMATDLLHVVAKRTEATHAVILLSTEGGALSPLAYSDEPARGLFPLPSKLADQCYLLMEPVVADSGAGTAAGYSVALPLRVGARMVGVVLAHLPANPAGENLSGLMREVDEHSLRLDTAMTFNEIRTMATIEERHRLSREIHDGIAQEVASLGYLVDNLQAGAESELQKVELQLLRNELGRVVSELRLSIFDLRSDVSSESGLGAALTEYVRQVGSRSQLTVHLTLDEAATRLRADTETELLRIAGEAITNARKHSGANNLWVDCTVHPPSACVEIRDDGMGIGPRRFDSYGLRIMKERADRIDAQLEIHETARGSARPGTTVRVSVGEPLENVVPTEREKLDDTPRSHHSAVGG